MPPVKKTATSALVPFGSLSFYAGGSRMLPRGLYAMEHHVHMFTPTKNDGTPSGKAPFLAVQLTAHPIDEEGNSTGEPIQQQLSMGSKASLSFQPDPDSGKGLVPVPGGPASTLPTNTNWQLYLKSLYDAGLPEGVVEGSLEVLDGIWVRTDNVPEPEERKGYAGTAATGEAAQDQQHQGPKLVPSVIEILENGKPWENTGGIPSGDAPKKPAPRAAGKAAPKAQAKPAPAPAPEPEPDSDTETAASNAITAVLENPANANGCTKIALRTGTFKALGAAGYDAGSVKAIMDATFANDAALNAILAPLGYTVSGLQIKVA